MPLHVVQLGPVPPPEGGISRNVLAIRDELVSTGNKCSIIATSKSTEISDDPGIHHPRTFLSFLKTLRSIDSDILHLHIGGDITSRVLSLAFACAVFGRGKKVLSVHSGGFAKSKRAEKASKRSLAGMVFRRFDHAITVNNGLADVLRGFGVGDEKISVILPFALTPPDSNVAVPGDLAEFYKKHSPILLAVGGLEKDYDPLMQIAAMKEVLDQLPNAGLMIVGDGSMRSEVETEIKNSGYAGSIFLAGNVDHAVTLHLINDADILLRTTLFDGDAISIREAIFLGTPVIATDNGMRPDGADLIPIGDKAQLIRMVIEIIAEQRSRKSTAESDASNIRSVVEIYKKLARVTVSC